MEAITSAEYPRAAELFEHSLALSARSAAVGSEARAMNNLGFALLNIGNL